MPNLMQIVISVSHRKMCGLCGETAVDAECSPVIDGSAVCQHGHSHHLGQTALRNVTPVQSVIPPQQLLSQPINCAECCLLLLDRLVDVAPLWTQSLSFRTVWVNCVSLMGIMICFVVQCFEGLYICLARCRGHSQTMEEWEVLWLLILCRFLDFIFKEVQILQLFKINFFFSFKQWNCKSV